MRNMTWDEVRELDIELYTLILDKESHHNHPIVMDDRGIIRWEENKLVRELADIVGLNYIVEQFYEKGYTRNNEKYREFYRNLGYSLNGYWEIFYWELNNDEADEYKGGQLC